MMKSMLSEGDPLGLASGLLERRIHHPRVENKLNLGDPPGLVSGFLERRIHHPRVENELDLGRSWIDDVDRGWIMSHLFLRLGN